jgi:hypothetical protein
MTSRDARVSVAKEPQTHDHLRQVDRALGKLREIVLQGLEHGFFEITIIGEITKEQKRRLLIKAGNSFQFVIAAHELGLDDRS